MNNIKTLIIQFSNILEKYEIPLFRGAVIASLDDKNVLFHNHQGDHFRYSYPLIQYKRIHQKAAIVAIGDGINSVSKLIVAKDININIGEKTVSLELESTNIQRTDIGFIAEMKEYSICQWLPLNQNNYEEYTKYNNIIDRIEMLQRTLVGNIISMAKGLNIHYEDRINLKIKELKELKPVIFKHQKMIAFDATFTVNLNLPNNIGLGKGVSLGFGTIKELSKNKSS